MIVHLAEEGTGEDRLVVGVFRLPNKATEYLAKRNDGDLTSTTITEWELDDTDSPSNEIAFVAVEGRDEDRGVVGVFNTQKAADDFLDARNDGLDPISCQVSAWRIDDIEDPSVEISHERFDG